jgi:hypothetical protein
MVPARTSGFMTAKAEHVVSVVTNPQALCHRFDSHVDWSPPLADGLRSARTGPRSVPSRDLHNAIPEPCRPAARRVRRDMRCPAAQSCAAVSSASASRSRRVAAAAWSEPCRCCRIGPRRDAGWGIRPGPAGPCCARRHGAGGRVPRPCPRPGPGPRSHGLGPAWPECGRLLAGSLGQRWAAVPAADGRW